MCKSHDRYDSGGRCSTLLGYHCLLLDDLTATTLCGLVAENEPPDPPLTNSDLGRQADIVGNTALKVQRTMIRCDVERKLLILVLLKEFTQRMLQKVCILGYASENAFRGLE